MKSYLLPLIFLFSVQSLFAESQFKTSVLLPLTGPVAEYGIALQQGIMLAQEQDPALFKNCAFIFEDTAYDSKRSVAAFQKAVSLDQSNLIYSWGSTPSEPLAPLAEQAQFPLLTNTSDPLLAKGRTFVIRHANTGSELARPLSAHFKRSGFKKIALIKVENPYFNSIISGLIEQLPEEDAPQIVASFLPSELDFRSAIVKLRQGNYDAIGLFVFPGQVSQVARLIRQQNITAPLFGTDNFDSENEISQAKGALEHSVFPNNIVTETFRANYLAKFKSSAQITSAAAGYDLATMVCAKVADSSRVLTGREILQKLSTIKSFSGALGESSYTETEAGDRYFKFAVALKRITGGKIILDYAGG